MLNVSPSEQNERISESNYHSHLCSFKPRHILHIFWTEVAGVLVVSDVQVSLSSIASQPINFDSNYNVNDKDNHDCRIARWEERTWWGRRRCVWRIREHPVWSHDISVNRRVQRGVKKPVVASRYDRPIRRCWFVCPNRQFYLELYWLIFSHSDLNTMWDHKIESISIVGIPFR